MESNITNGSFFEARRRARSRSRRIGYSLLLGLVAVAVSVIAREKRSASSAPLSHEAYVWQRSWDGELSEAVTTAGAHLPGLLTLAGEITVKNGSFKTRRIPVSHAALRQPRGKTCAVVRVFPSVATAGWKTEATGACDTFLHAVVAEWSREHPGGISLQIDFDCPESRLAAFHEQLLRWRKMFPEVTISFTALPTWLKNPAFAPLARDFPDYVLQVHSLHLPGKADGWIGLCDPSEMRSAIKEAAKIGVPFRLALPTYSCLVVFDENGAVAEVYGEDLPEALPLGALDTIAMDSDPHLLSTLLREWEEARPREMRGIVWYRLPTPRDRLNWDWQTLKQVIDGTPMIPRWSLYAEPDPAGFHRLVLRNDGNAPDDLPRLLRLHVPDADAVGSDGLAGYLSTDLSTPESLTGATFEWHLVEPLRQFQKPPAWSGVVGWCRWQGGSGPPAYDFPKF